MMQTLGIVMVVMFGLVAICLFFHFVAYTIPGWVPDEIPTRNRNARTARTRNATTADGIIAPLSRAHVVANGGPMPRAPGAYTLPRTANGITVANGVTGAGATSGCPDNGSGGVGIQLAIVPQFVRINGNGGNGGSSGSSDSNSNSNSNARPAVPRVAGRAPSRRAAPPPEYDPEAGLADPPPSYSEGLGEDDAHTVIARAA